MRSAARRWKKFAVSRNEERGSDDGKNKVFLSNQEKKEGGGIASHIKILVTI
jgi:hypothetical protein